MSPAQLRRVRWGVRLVLVLGVAASVAANILHARDNAISETIAAWPPLALLLTVELISRVPVHRRSLAGVRILATAAIAGIAAWVSYWHMAGVAGRYGETGSSPYLLPLSVDGLVVVASVSLVELAARIRSVPLVPLAPPGESEAAPEGMPSLAAPPAQPSATPHEATVPAEILPERQRKVPSTRAQRAEAADRYRASVAAGTPLTGAQIGALYGFGARWGRDRIADANGAPPNVSDDAPRPIRPNDHVRSVDRPKVTTTPNRRDAA